MLFQTLLGDKKQNKNTNTAHSMGSLGKLYLFRGIANRLREVVSPH